MSSQDQQPQKPPPVDEEVLINYLGMEAMAKLQMLSQIKILSIEREEKKKAGGA